MTKRPDVYTTLGTKSECCGHRTVGDGRCLEDGRNRPDNDALDAWRQSTIASSQ